MKIWKKNALVATVMLFVCVAVYLNWSYNRGNELDGLPVDETKKNLGQSSLVLGEGDGMGVALLPEGEDGNAAAPAGDTSNDYFANARLARQQARDGAISILKGSAENSEVSQEVRDAAIAEVNVTASAAMKEAKIENLVVAKGFSDCVAFIQGDKVSVVVAAPPEGLESADVAKITEIVRNEAGVTTDQIHITEIAPKN